MRDGSWLSVSLMAPSSLGLRILFWSLERMRVMSRTCLRIDWDWLMREGFWIKSWTQSCLRVISWISLRGEVRYSSSSLAPKQVTVASMAWMRVPSREWLEEDLKISRLRMVAGSRRRASEGRYSLTERRFFGGAQRLSVA